MHECIKMQINRLDTQDSGHLAIEIVPAELGGVFYIITLNGKELQTTDNMSLSTNGY